MAHDSSRNRTSESQKGKRSRAVDRINKRYPKERTERGPELSDLRGTSYKLDPDQWISHDGLFEPTLNWVGLPVTLDRSNLHFLVAGVPGTGKTLSIKLLMQSIFSNEVREMIERGGIDFQSVWGMDRAILYDPKQEFYPFLLELGISESRIVITNPFDLRRTGWDLAKDYLTPTEAYQLATTLIPTPPNSQQPFYPKSAAALLTAVLVGFMEEKPGEWDLADVIKTCANVSTIESFLLRRATLLDLSATIALSLFGSNETRHNVMAELCSHLFELMPIAARWRTARTENKLFSIRNDFMKSNDKIVLLGANEIHKEALRSINRLFIKRFSELILDEAGDNSDSFHRTWVILDELRELGKIQGLADLINKGRSRGVCALLGFQDYLGLKESFGENIAHEITASCAHKVYLRLGGESAKWASSSIGDSEKIETKISVMSSQSFSKDQSKASTVGKDNGVNWSINRSDSTGVSSSKGISHADSSEQNFTWPDHDFNTHSIEWQLSHPLEDRNRPYDKYSNRREGSFSRSSEQHNSSNIGSTLGGTMNSHKSKTYSEGKGISSTSQYSFSFEKSKSEVVLPSEISHLPHFIDVKALTGFICKNETSGTVKCYKIVLPMDYFDDVKSKNSGIPGYIPCKPEDQDLSRVLKSYESE